MEKVRLQKLLAESGMCSRRKAEELIKQGKVTVNGRAAHIGDGATVKDIIAVDGEKLPIAKKREKYYLNTTHENIVNADILGEVANVVLSAGITSISTLLDIKITANLIKSYVSNNFKRAKEIIVTNKE